MVAPSRGEWAVFEFVVLERARLLLALTTQKSLLRTSLLFLNLTPSP